MPIRKRTAWVRAAGPLIAGLPLLAAAPAAAQSYAVVQPTASPAAADLNAALRRLARAPADLDALIAAGRASLAMGDIDAAIGFFGRADVVRPGDARVKAGLASARLKSDQPIEALQLFEQALAAGVPAATIAADRGLAYDLVGDNASAQAQYRLVLAQGADAEVSRRLGVSQAISGDRKGFEATLLPLLQRRDFAAYRARSFGLAILGEEQEAVSIAEAVMPRDLSSRITPYLRYMPRLTRAQQAAAANLGAFPRAAQIGRDDPRFAQYAPPSTPAAPTAPRTADARLAPAGEPLGPRVAAADTARVPRPATAAERALARREDKARKAAEEAARRQPPVASAPAAAPVQPASAPAARPTIAVATPAPAPTPIRVQTPPPSSAPTVVVARAGPPATVAAPAPVQPPRLTLPAPTPTPTPTPAIAVAAPQPASPAPAPVATPPPAPIVVARAEPAVAAPVAPASAPEPQNLADAFAEFAAADGARTPAAGAVDISRIRPKREGADAAKPAPPPPPPPPAKPKAPSRIWVQVATGKDAKALAFDWGKLGKKAPALLGKRSAYTAKWGETRRLLTGPFDSTRAAAKFVADLKAAGLDSFAFTSAEGEDVAALK